MKSWSLTSPKTLVLQESDPQADEDLAGVKVRVSKAELSVTDISCYKGEQIENYPRVLARAATGLISESDDASFKKGQKVYLSPYAGDQPEKVRGVDVDGYLSDYVIVSSGDVFPLPEGLTDEEALFIDDIALAISAIEKLDLKKTEYLVVFGASAINCIISQLAIYYQAIPILVDNNRERLELAENSGIYYTVNVQEEDLRQKINEITGGQFAHTAIYNSDAAFHVESILPLVKNGGRICFMGFNKKPQRILADLSELLRKELTLFGVNNAKSELETAINMLANDIISVGAYVREIVSFDQVPDTLQELESMTTYAKTIVDCL